MAVICNLLSDRPHTMDFHLSPNAAALRDEIKCFVDHELIPLEGDPERIQAVR